MKGSGMQTNVVGGVGCTTVMDPFMKESGLTI
jgi:hypothetical protein